MTKPPTPEQKMLILTKLAKYYGPLIDRGFCGRVTATFDRGFLQQDIRRDENDKVDAA